MVLNNRIVYHIVYDYFGESEGVQREFPLFFDKTM